MLNADELDSIKGFAPELPDPVSTLDQVSSLDPERSAQVLDIAVKRELPTTAVEPNLDEFQRQERVEKAEAENFGPALNRMMGNRDYAAILQDDLENLKATEEALDNRGFFGKTGGVLQSMVLDLGTGVAGTLQAFYEAQAYGQGGTSVVSEFFREIALSGKSKSEEVMPEFESEELGSVVGGVKSAVNFMTLMALTKGQALIPMAGQAGSLSYIEAREQGLDVEKALPYAFVQGGIEYATEKLPFDTLVKGWGKDGFMKLLRNQLMIEIPSEQVATLLQDLNDWVMLPENADQPFSAYIDERPNAALQTAIATVVGTSVQTSAVSVADRLINGQLEKEDTMVRGLLNDANQLAVSESEQERLDNIITLGQESKKGAPGNPAQVVYKEFLSGAGSDQSVFIPAEILENLATEMEVPQALLDQVDALGGDVEIPMDTFMSEIVHNEQLMEGLRPHMKLGRDVLSASEIEKGGSMTTRRLLERAQVNADLKTEADEIWETVKDQLVDTGRVTNSEASIAAQLYPAMAAVAAERYGISPAEVFERMNFTIEGPAESTPADDSQVLQSAAAKGEIQKLLDGAETFTTTENGEGADRVYTVSASKGITDIHEGTTITLNADEALAIRKIEAKKKAGLLTGNEARQARFDVYREGYKRNAATTESTPADDSQVLTMAQESGYEGEDAGEGKEWLAGMEKYGAEGMTQEARYARAESMGIDTSTPWFHGTDKTFGSFDGMTFVTEHQGEASAYGTTPEFRQNLRRESFFNKVTKGELSPEEFGSVPYVGIVGDIDGEGVWATDNGVVRVTGKGRGRSVEYMSNAVVDYTSTPDDANTITIVEGESTAYEDHVESLNIPENVESSPQVVPVYIRDGKFKELGPLEANILGTRLRTDMTEAEQVKYDELLLQIEQWKKEGFIGVSTVSDDIGFSAASEEGPPQQRILFDPADIRSVNAVFDTDQSDSTNILDQSQVEMGININDSTQPFTEQILSGEKTIETRNTDSLRPYVGKRVGIVRTGKGKATLVGYATIGEPIVYTSEEQFRADESKHRVAAGSNFDIGKEKYGYPITDVEKIEPVEVESKGIVSRKLAQKELGQLSKRRDMVEKLLTCMKGPG